MASKDGWCTIGGKGLSCLQKTKEDSNMQCKCGGAMAQRAGYQRCPGCGRSLPDSKRTQRNRYERLQLRRQVKRDRKANMQRLLGF